MALDATESMKKMLEGRPSIGGNAAPAESSLSDLAKDILKATVESLDNLLFVSVGAKGIGLIVQAGMKNFNANDQRERVFTEAAIEELIKHGLIKTESKSAYRVTKKGYTEFDKLKESAANA